MPIDYCGLDEINPFIRLVAINGGSDKSYFVPERMIYDFEALFIIQGECEVIEENKRYTINKDCFHIMKPFVWHKRQLKPDGSCFYYDMHFDFVYLPDNPPFHTEEEYWKPCNLRIKRQPPSEILMTRKILMPREFDCGFDCKRIYDSNKMIDCFAELRNGFTSDKSEDKLHVKVKFFEILELLLADAGIVEERQILSKDLIMMFVAQVTKEFDREIDINEFCKKNGLSPGYFRKIFREVMGKAPYDYQVDLRIEKAAELLRGGRYTVKQISSSVGYQDEHYFSRLFKNRMKLNPTAYAENMRTE